MTHAYNARLTMPQPYTARPIRYMTARAAFTPLPEVACGTMKLLGSAPTGSCAGRLRHRAVKTVAAKPAAQTLTTRAEGKAC